MLYKRSVYLVIQYSVKLLKMKAALLILILGVAALQGTYAQCIRSAPVLSSSAPVLVGSNAVATSLADTLSLLTVSSLLSEKLPLGYPMVAPIAPVAPIAVGGCGCGGFGYPYGSYII